MMSSIDSSKDELGLPNHSNMAQVIQHKVQSSKIKSAVLQDLDLLGSINSVLFI